MYTVIDYVDPKGQPAVERYAMLRGMDGAELSEKVNNHLEAGFVLYGHPIVSDRFVCQAMVKYKASKKERN